MQTETAKKHQVLLALREAYYKTHQPVYLETLYHALPEMNPGAIRRCLQEHITGNVATRTERGFFTPLCSSVEAALSWGYLTKSELDTLMGHDTSQELGVFLKTGNVLTAVVSIETGEASPHNLKTETYYILRGMVNRYRHRFLPV